MTLSLPVFPGRLKASGTVIEGTADASQRAAIAEALGIVSLDRLHWRLIARPWRKHGFSLEGSVSADVVQSCVVTLEPVAQSVEETVDLHFLPVEDGHDAQPRDVDWAFDAASEDEPDRFEGDMVDAGALVIEHLALGLDPYPRKEGAEYSEPAETTQAGETNAALADALRKWQGKSR